MRIASYNILSGGFDSYNYTDPTPQRINILQKAVTKIDADLIGLIDTFRWDSIYTNKQIADMFSYKNAYCINLEDERLKNIGHNNGITVLTNLTSAKFETIRIRTRNAIKTEIVINGNKINIFSVYLDDISEDTRIEQLRSLMKFTDKNIPTIFMGDMNMLSPDDLRENQPLIKRFANKNPAVYKGMLPVLDEMKKCKAINIFKKTGYIDAGEKVGPTTPTQLFPAKVDGAVIRLDYLFHSEKLEIKDFEVLKDGIFGKASDHFPIVCEVVV